ncbi:MAG: tetratricopeptide repeat protein [Chloroflexota bacterium]
MNTELKQQIYKMIFYGHITNAEKILSGDLALSPCLLALVYAIQNKTKQAEEILLDARGRNCDAIDQLACEEAEMIIAFAKTGTSSALAKATKIIESHSNAAVAHYFVAQNALQQRMWDVALKHYQNILQLYPDNDGLLLDIAKVLFFLKKNNTALDYAQRAKPSLRQKMYKILIPLGRPIPRVTALLAIFGLFVITGVNPFIYIWLIVLMGIVFFANFRKDMLISSSALYLATFSTIIWLFIHWVKSW